MMFDFFFTFFFAHPRRLVVIGRALYRLAAFQVLAGMVAQFVAAAASIGQFGRVLPAPLASWLPGLWTWWIPETVAGMVLVATVGAIGLAIAFEGRQADRQPR